MDPIGASSTWRWYGYDNSWVMLDGQPVQSVSGGGHWGGGMFINARDLARFGCSRCAAASGSDQQILSEEWVQLALTPTPAQPTYGFMNWFLNTDRKRYTGRRPSSAFVHVGNGTNIVYVDPEQRSRRRRALDRPPLLRSDAGAGAQLDHRAGIGDGSAPALSREAGDVRGDDEARCVILSFSAHPPRHSERSEESRRRRAGPAPPPALRATSRQDPSLRSGWQDSHPPITSRTGIPPFCVRSTSLSSSRSWASSDRSAVSSATRQPASRSRASRPIAA